MSTWYLGPLGDLRPLTCPEPGIPIKDVRYGGVHQGLSGARTMDVTGHRSEFQFEFKWMDQDEWAWLDAMHTRHVFGPFRLINPLKKNRLTIRSTSMIGSRYLSRRDGVLCAATFEQSLDYPGSALLPIRGRSLKMTTWGTDLGYCMFDHAKPLPILPGETYTASAYLKADNVHPGARIQVDWYDRDGVRLFGADADLGDVTTTWKRFAVEGFSPPAEAAGMVVIVVAGANNTPVYVAAPQLEVGPLTDWEIGGAAPEVLIDQLETTTPRFPLRDATLTLLEA